jgi:synaptojanin
MSYDKRRIIRLYGDTKSYVLTSQAIENEKLQIKCVDASVCLNKMSNDEWLAMTQMRTNSIRSATYSLILDSYGCLGMLSTAIFSSPNEESANNVQHFLIFVKEAQCVGTLKKFDIMRITDVYVIALNGGAELTMNINSGQQTSGGGNNYASYMNELKKFLSSGVFYFVYSPDPNSTFDLTLSSQLRYMSHGTHRKFLWNYNLHVPFRRLNVDCSRWLLNIICGFVDIKKVIILSKAYKACLFSRLSCERTGTRFNCRGINDDGQCANFVETEQVVYSCETDEEASFVQLRGSVPVFFEQTGLQVGSHRIRIMRGLEACYPAYERHIKSLIQDYGTKIFILNLLGQKGDESILTDYYLKLCDNSPFAISNQLIYANFDYHQELKMNKQSLGEKMWPNLVHQFYSENHKQNSVEGMCFYLGSNRGDSGGGGGGGTTYSDSDSAIVGDTSSISSNSNSLQTHVNNPNGKLQAKFIRTNCMDCLDRTNNVQSFIGIEMLRYQLAHMIAEIDMSKFREVFRQMWIVNGDCISKIYAGTGAIQGIQTGRH